MALTQALRRAELRHCPAPGGAPSAARRRASRRIRGFTLIELLVVLAIVALLLTIATPRYVDHVERAKEATLRVSLKTMRDAIDHFDAEQGRWPSGLEELVERRYLAALPVDPLTDRRDSWIAVTPAELANPPADAPSVGLADVHSGAAGAGRDGTPYRDW
jgi:general secretion pathway protein G